MPFNLFPHMSERLLGFDWNSPLQSSHFKTFFSLLILETFFCSFYDFSSLFWDFGTWLHHGLKASSHPPRYSIREPSFLVSFGEFLEYVCAEVF